MANLGEVTYDVRFNVAKAKADLAAIEAEANAMAGRIGAKMGGIGGVGGGSSAAASGAVSKNGQPAGGTGPASYAATGSAGFAVGTPGGGPGQSAAAAMVGAAQRANIGTSAGFAYPFAGGGGGLNAGIGGGFTMPNVGYPMGFGGGGAGGAGGSSSGGGRGSPVATMAARITALALDVAIAGLNAEANFAKNMQNAGTNGFAQARAATQYRRDAFGLVPLVGGSLGNIATYLDDMYIDRTEAGSNLIGTLGRAGYAGNISSRSAQATRLSSLPYTQQNLRAGIAFSSRSAEIQDKISAVKASADFQKQLFSESDYGVLTDQLNERDPAEQQRLNKKYPSLYDDGQLAGRRSEAFQYAMRKNRELNDQANLPFKAQTAASAAQNKADLALIQDERQKELGYGGASIASRQLANQLRPTAGVAAQAVGEARTDFEIYNRQNAAFRNDPLNAGKLNDDKDPMINRINSRIADLGGERTAALTNLFGGRPQEIGGLQSVEAMRDLSPENVGDKLDALAKAIDELTREMASVRKGP